MCVLLDNRIYLLVQNTFVIALPVPKLSCIQELIMSKSNDGKIEVFTKTITLKNGKVLHASDVGKNCFRFFVKEKKPKK